ncbi:MAG: hypothetical protein HY315_00480 [Acidobacteria bacterium]|nr:hypothetical protein [Acidobacteriota bacterium]
MTTAAGCNWTTTSNVPWLSTTSGAIGSGNGTVNYSITANSTATARTGTLTIAGQTITLTQAAAGQELVAVGFSVLSGSPGQIAPSGAAVFSFTQNGILLAEAGVPASPLTTAARLFADVSPPQVNTGVAVANPNSTPARVTATLFDSSGALMAALGLPAIPPRGQTAAFINDLFPSLRAPFRGVLEITSDVAVAALTLRQSVNARGEIVLTTLPVADLSTAVGFNPATLPHIGSGSGLRTQFILLNPTETAVTGKLLFRGQEGQPLALSIGGVAASTLAFSLPPKGAQLIETQDTQDLKIGSATVEVTPGSFAPVASAVLRIFANNVLITEAGVAAAELTSSGRLLVEAKKMRNTGFAVTNPSVTDPLLLNVSLRNIDGLATGLSTVLEIPPGGQIAKFAKDLFPSVQVPFVGVLDLSGSSNFAATALRQTTNPRSEPILTTVPLANLVRQTGEDTLIFPHLVQGAGFQTEIILLDTAGAPLAGTARFLAQSGEAMTLAFAGQSSTELNYKLSPHGGEKFEQTAIRSLSVVRGTSGTLVRIGGTGFKRDSRVAFGNIEAKSLMALSENGIAVFVPLSGTEGALAPLPRGLYAVRVDDSLPEDFSVLDPQPHSNPPGTVLDRAIRLFTEVVTQQDSSVKAALAAARVEVQDPLLLDYINQLENAGPELESFLQNDLPNLKAQLDSQSLSALEQFLAAAFDAPVAARSGDLPNVIATKDQEGDDLLERRKRLEILSKATWLWDGACIFLHHPYVCAAALGWSVGVGSLELAASREGVIKGLVVSAGDGKGVNSGSGTLVNLTFDDVVKLRAEIELQRTSPVPSLFTIGTDFLEEALPSYTLFLRIANFVNVKLHDLLAKRLFEKPLGPTERRPISFENLYRACAYSDGSLINGGLLPCSGIVSVVVDEAGGEGWALGNRERFRPEDWATVTWTFSLRPGILPIDIISPEAARRLGEETFTDRIKFHLQEDPRPEITELIPDSARVSSSFGIELRVRGRHLRNARVGWGSWGGYSDRLTRSVSDQEVIATIYSTDLEAPGEVPVYAHNDPAGAQARNIARYVSNPVRFRIEWEAGACSSRQKEGSAVQACPVPKPFPQITGLGPPSAVAGGADFKLNVNGKNFLPNSVVKWNGSSRVTTFVSSSQLSADIPAADIRAVGAAQIIVVNPQLGGDRSSNALAFTVNAATTLPPVITSLNPSSANAGGPGFSLIVNGTNFVEASVVRWDGAARPTQYGGSSRLSAAISADDIKNEGSASVTVVNPSPVGTSNAQTFTINAGTPCSYSLSSNSQSFGSGGGSGSVGVTAPSICAWTVTKGSSDSWITITSVTSSAGTQANGGTGNGTVNYSVTANAGTTSRTGTLTIGGQTLTITQAGGNPIEGSWVGKFTVTPTQFCRGTYDWQGTFQVSGGAISGSWFDSYNQARVSFTGTFDGTTARWSIQIPGDPGPTNFTTSTITASHIEGTFTAPSCTGSGQISGTFFGDKR